MVNFLLELGAILLGLAVEAALAIAWSGYSFLRMMGY
jgi:hypothetical protein